MRRTRILSMCVVFSMIFGMFAVTGNVRSEDVGAAPITDIGGPAATFRDVAWHHDMNYAMAVGNDSSNNGVIYSYFPDSDAWNLEAIEPDVDFNGITKTEPYFWGDDMEKGNNSWTTNTWQGTLNWHQVDPTTLPPARLIQPHGSAYSGSTIWWFGNDPTGDYDTGAHVAGSLVSPAVYLPSISTLAAIGFQHWFEVEPWAPGGPDKMIVSVKNVTDTGWTQIAYWDSGNTSFTSWKQEIIVINPWFLGNFVQLNFTFDSVDGTNNNLAGWHIDDVFFYTNDVFIAVGEPGAVGYSVYSGSYLSGFNNIGGLSSVDFNDVAAGSIGATFAAVGDFGDVCYWNTSSWHTILGAGSLDTLMSVDFNGTHYFIVGYNATGHGVGYYIPESDIFNGRLWLHPMPGAPDMQLNDVAWSNNITMGSEQGLGVVAGDGKVWGLMDPEIWKMSNTNTAPPWRLGHSLVYDSANKKMLMFGGSNGTYQNDTWRYDPATKNWTNMYPANSPSPRYGHAMVYDRSLNRIVLFGGRDNVSNCNDTWVYNPVLNNWTNLNAAGGPSARYRHQMVYTLNDRIILFGGDTGAPNGETWEFSGNTWTNLTPGIVGAPSPRCDHAMAFDTARNCAVLFGGGSGSYQSDTWIFNASTDTWTNMSPPTSPPARVRHSIVYDSYRERVLLFGGDDGSASDDTWTYNPSTNRWFNWFPANKPSPRRDFAMAYNPSTGYIMLFSGNSGDSQTWNCAPNRPWTGDRIAPQAARGTNNEVFNGVAWDEKGKQALAVGYDSTNNTGVVYSFTEGNDFVARVSDSFNALPGHPLYSVAFTHSSPTYGFAVGGSAMKVWTTAFANSNLILNTNFPHINWIGFNVTDMNPINSRTNDQVIVDPGTYTQEYLITCSGYHSDGVGEIGEIEVWVWYDNGFTGPGSSYWNLGPEVGNTNENLRFSMIYDVSLNSFSMPFPNQAQPEPEVTLNLGNCIYDNNPTGDGQNFTIQFAFYPHQQVRNASGVSSWAFPYAQNPRTPHPNQVGDINALDAPFSWDFRVEVRDTMSAGLANAYDEFGFFKYESLTVAGLPGGGTVMGQGPPSTNDVQLLPINSNVTYSANCDHNLSVYLYGQILGPGSNLQGDTGASIIPVTDFSTTGGDLMVETYFPGPGQAGDWTNRLYYLGQLGWQTPRDFSRTSATDNMGMMWDINFEVDIPACVEDTYRGTLVYVLGRPV